MCAFHHARIVLGLLLLCLLVANSDALGQTARGDLWVTNGMVDAIAVHDSTLYVGGLFDRVGPPTGSALPIDALTGSVLGTPKVAGIVYDIEPDGAGGWYVAGDFTHVGGQERDNIAHIGADHVVTMWDPGANGAVRSVKRVAGTVYAGGTFTQIGGQPRTFLVALDAITGDPTAWAPQPTGFVRGILVSGETVYVCGDFPNIGGQARNQLAAVSATTGLATVWNPNANNRVNTIAFGPGVIYAGGLFTTIGGQARGFLAAIDTSTGLATAWNPNPNQFVEAVVVDGSTIFVGGFFGLIGGMSRSGLAAVDATSGLATAWAPNPNAIVYALDLDGSTLYVGGGFTSIGGQSRSRLAAIDAITGSATSWDPDPNEAVRALAHVGSTVYAGGGFSSVGGVDRNNLAAIDLTTGAATAWDPAPSGGPVRALATLGNTIIVAGDFSAIGGQPRQRIAAVDAITQLATPWDPSANGDVYAVAVDGNAVYVGGDFTTVGGQPRNHAAALDAATGLATAWNPNANGRVETVTPSGTIVYAGGDFTSIGGFPRNRIAAVQSVSGSASTWDPNASNTVRDIEAHNGRVYVGGDFTTIGGQSRSYLAALDPLTGLATTFDPNLSASVHDLALSGNTLYLAGNFIAAEGMIRPRAAAYNTATGSLTKWGPFGSYPFTTNAVLSGDAVIVRGGTVYVGGAFHSASSEPQSGIAAVTQAPSITAIVPNFGGSAGLVTVTLIGAGFQGGATVDLGHMGETGIPGTSVEVSNDGTTLTATFNLTGALEDAWNVTLGNPDLLNTTVANGFTIVPPVAHQLRVDIIGPSLVRANRLNAFDIVIENLGNTDVSYLPLWITGIPVAATIEPAFTVAAVPQDAGEPDWTALPLTLGGLTGRYMSMVIPRVPPGVTVRRISIDVPALVTSYTLKAALAPRWFDHTLLRACLTGQGVITDANCMGMQLTEINAHLDATPGIEALNGIGVWAKIGWKCEGAATLPAAIGKAEAVLDLLAQTIEEAGVPAGCLPVVVPFWSSDKSVTVVTSVDPNDKLGSEGTGSESEVGRTQLLPYSIRFENFDTATAPAQFVTVTDALDGETMDFSSLSLGPMTFGSQTLTPPPGLHSYTTDVDLRPENDLIVRVSVSFDDATGVINWNMTSIDPATGALPAGPLVGFLPPNVTPPEGEGSLLFTIMPKPTVANGTEITNKATIVFDGGMPIETNEWSNIIDDTPPSSQVLELTPDQSVDSLTFTVQWDTQGPPPDLRDVSVYCSIDGGPYFPWRLHSTATADTFASEAGHSYAFYSLARDSSGNLEEAPGSPDAQTATLVSVGQPRRLALALEGAHPNPARDVARVWFTLPNRGPAAFDVIDVAGRRILRREVGHLGPGRHMLDVTREKRLAPGLYFLRLSQGDRAVHARMVVIR